MTRTDRPRDARLACSALAFAASVLLLCACSNKKATITDAPVTVRDVPAPLRGTISSMSSMRGIDPILVTGYSLVVGLKGTGDTTVREDVAAAVIRNLRLAGIGSINDPLRGTMYAGMTPEQILMDRSTAVVQVIAAIPPGLPKSSTFDVTVVPAPQSAAGSLEGGYLVPVDLDIAPGRQYEGFKTRTIASASGDIYVNPFDDNAEGGQGSDAAAGLRLGRVLDGGVVTSDEGRISIVLDNPSSTIARQVVASINTRFPNRADPAARGRSDRLIDLTVPPAYLDVPEEFVLLVQHRLVDNSMGELSAKRFTRAMQDEPGLGVQLSWCLEALGDEAVPFARELYEHTDYIPRMGALRAGARLGDVHAVAPLIDIANAGAESDKIEAIELLADLDIQSMPVAEIDRALMALSASPQLTVRMTAAEGLMKRASRAYAVTTLGRQAAYGTTQDTERMLRSAGRGELPFPRDHIRGVSRYNIENKFVLDAVPFGEPMIYVTQRGKPRVVVMGERVAAEPDAFASLWSSRLMFRSGLDSRTIEVFFQPDRTDDLPAPTVQNRVNAQLTEIVQYLARTPTAQNPQPGLAMSYSQVVGILSELQTQGVVTAEFAREQDREQAILAHAVRSNRGIDRPENEDDSPGLMDDLFTPDGRLRATVPTPGEIKAKRSLVVPIPAAEEK